MRKKHFLFSTNTRLSYIIAENYYKNIHYVWCAPIFDYAGNQPASSNPMTICNRLLQDIKTKDEHSQAIYFNRAGLLRGVEAKRLEGVVDRKQEKEIRALIQKSSFEMFMPLIYIIPYAKVKSICVDAPVGIKANRNAEELIIDKLPREYFEIIDVGEITRGTGIIQQAVVI